ncbi:hypothetical protein C5C74_04970 [Rathayibacter sp. AY1E8]|uniref:putative Ig domain-containing protein n=1 Tax=Rathayibacter sp. AY1E8 TaxID=2080555 RepID=UPI000CE73530|nr:putative Ig domain-containing protein [Rathayibacter sp. AY1E8]PPG20249.1 hypothetical protein C5C74_04970 [Rathayibacter sp. AY1E8]
MRSSTVPRPPAVQDGTSQPRDPGAARRLRRGLLGLTAAVALLVGTAVPLAAVAAPSAPVLGVAAWGSGTDGKTTVPAGVEGVLSLAAGRTHSLAANGDGGVVAWGRGSYGQTSVPDGLTGVVAVSAGDYSSHALKSDGTVVSWGYDGDGQVSRSAALTGIVAISSSRDNSLALGNDGTVTSWGSNGLGEGLVPAGLGGVTAIAAGQRHSLAVSGGRVVAWGWDLYGQTDVPAGLEGVVAVAAGETHSLALKEDGTVVAWGASSDSVVVDYGQTTVPEGLSGVVAIAAASDYSLALKGDGTIVGWGRSSAGQLQSPAGLAGTTALAAGPDHVLARGPRPVLTADAPPASGPLGAAASYTFAADRPASFAIASGSLPDGLTLSASGLLSGTPTTAGTSTFAVSARNPFGSTVGAPHTFAVAETTVAPTLAGDPPAATVGTPYDFDYSVTGTPAPTVSLVSGTLPAGLSLDDRGGLTGTPTADGRSTFTLRASNAAGSAETTSTVVVSPAAAAPAISGTPGPGVVGTAYDFGYTVSGFPAPSVAVSSGALPSGLTLTPAGRLTGTPSAPGTFTFTLAARAGTASAETTSTVTVSSPTVAPTLSGTVAAGVVGSAYDFRYAVSGTPAPSVSLVSGALPAGLTLDATGRLSGTPTTAGTTTFSIQAANSAGTARATSTLTVSPKQVATKADLRVDLSGPASAVKGRTLTYTLITTNAGPAASASVVSQVVLPAGVQFVSATGSYTRVGNVVVFQRAGLADGRTVSEKITVRAAVSGTATALAAAFSTKTPDPSIRSNADTASTTIR